MFLTAEGDHSLLESELKPEEQQRRQKQRVARRKVDVMKRKEKAEHDQH